MASIVKQNAKFMEGVIWMHEHSIGIEANNIDEIIAVLKQGL